MIVRLKASDFIPLALVASILMALGGAFQTLEIQIPPNRTLAVPVAVLLSLPAALAASYVGTNDFRAIVRTATRRVSGYAAAESAAVLLIPTILGLAISNWQPSDFLLAGIRDYWGLWALSVLARRLVTPAASWFPATALFFTSVVAGTAGQTVMWWAWPVAQAQSPEAFWITVALIALASFAKTRLD
ncbi:MAG: hypothetical protein ACKOQ8_07840 [Micrococcales bacterium]